MKIIFAGTPDFSVPALQALIDSSHQVCAVYTQPDRAAGRGRKLRPSPVKALALEHGIPVEQPINFKQPESVQQLQNYQADLMIVVAYGLLLPKAVLETPRLGCINIHASLLPRWRGAAPIQRAILEGDHETGITLMQMDIGLDTGDMLARIPCQIEPDETGETLHDRLAPMGAQALIDLLPGLETGQVQPFKQDESLACYAHKLSKQEGDINWSDSAANIERKVRAFNPWPVAYSHLDGVPLRIWSAQAIDQPLHAEPGSISVSDDKRLLVSCGQNSQLEILELQPAGKRRMTAQAYLAAHSPDGKQLSPDLG